MKKIYIETTGCDILEHDTQRYAQYFRINGWEEVNSAEKADLVLLTTCAFTKQFEDFSIFSIKDLKKKMNNNSELVIGGCLPKINQKRLLSEFKGLYFGKNNEDDLDVLINAKIKIAEISWNDDINRNYFLIRKKNWDPFCSTDTFFEFKFAKNLSEKLKNDKYLKIFNNSFSHRTLLKKSGYFQVKVADGCNYQCSYCTIKKAKGNLISREPDRIIKDFMLGVKKNIRKYYLLEMKWVTMDEILKAR